jgi:hypothetical protein
MHPTDRTARVAGLLYLVGWPTQSLISLASLRETSTLRQKRAEDPARRKPKGRGNRERGDELEGMGSPRSRR